MQAFRISARVVARNTLVNLLGQVLPLLVSVIALPVIVRDLGSARYGLLSLAWVILGYFTVFDLGLRQSATKHVAEALARGDEEDIQRVIWTTLALQGFVGVLGSAGLLAAAPPLLEHILRIPADLLKEANGAFRLLALSIPIVLLSSASLGLLAAAQRFDLVNAVTVPVSVVSILLILIGARTDIGLAGILLLIMVLRSVTLVALLAMCAHIFPGLRRLVVPDATTAGRLLGFGFWVAVSNTVTPVLRYLNRFMIGALISASAVTYYSVPSDMMDRLWILPTSLVLALFPTLSALSGLGDRPRIQESFLRATRYLIVLMAPAVFLLTVMAGPILRVWMGGEFETNGTLVFQLLAVGALVAFPASIPWTVIQALGRADLTAKLYLVLAPLNVALDWFLVKHLGLPGAALSYLLKALIDTPLLFLLALRTVGMPLADFLGKISAAFLSALGGSLLVLAVLELIQPIELRLGFVLLIVIGFVVRSWRVVFTLQDRLLFRSLLIR